MTRIHAFELLSDPPEDVADVVALFGNDATLRCWVLQTLSGQADVTQFEGESARWSDLRDELATASLFDMGGKRTIVVRSADKFLSEHRPEIEKYIAKPATASRWRPTPGFTKDCRKIICWLPAGPRPTPNWA